MNENKIECKYNSQWQDGKQFGEKFGSLLVNERNPKRSRILQTKNATKKIPLTDQFSMSPLSLFRSTIQTDQAHKKQMKKFDNFDECD